MVGAGRVSPTPPWEAPTAAPRSVPASLRTGCDWRVGQPVFHHKFGEGVIITLEGSGADARAQVNFGRHGPKWLALAIARLMPVE